MVRTRFTLCLIALISSGATLQADTLRVPEDFATIPGAVAASASGDVILIAPGNHTGSVLVNATTLTFQAASPGMATIWNGTEDWVLHCLESSQITALDLTFRGANSSALIAAGGSTLRAERCTMEHNARGGAFAAGGGRLELFDCLIRENNLITHQSTNGFRCDNSGTTALVERCTIIIDPAGTQADGALLVSGSQAIIRDCQIISADRGIAVGENGTRVVATGNIFSNCGSALFNDRGGTLDAGNLVDADPTNDGGNLILGSNQIFFNNVRGSQFAQGNFVPRVDSDYLGSKTRGNVNRDPVFQVLIDRVDPAPSPEVNLSAQWFEIHRRSSDPSGPDLDLDGWTVADDPAGDMGDEGAVTFSSTSFGTGGSVAVAHDPLALQAMGLQTLFGGTIVGSGASGISLDPAGDELFLFGPSGTLIDAVVWGQTDDDAPPLSWSGPRVASTEQAVLARRAPLVDTDSANDWEHSELEGRVIFRPRQAFILR